MKKLTTLLILALGMSTAAFCQEASETAGDDFSLEGALAMFKKSGSVEEFERALNEQGNNVNNLDLNDDGQIDYITVEDIKDGDTHTLVLSTNLNEKEKQDIATIGIEKTGTDSAELQIEGDESLYANNTIVEPEDQAEALKPSGKGSAAFDEFDTSATAVQLNVWLWPSVRFLYAPTYIVWVSPYRWGFYPQWWRPWHPFPRTVFYTRCAPHRVYFHRTPTRRVVVAHRLYAPRRHASTLVVYNRRGRTVVHGYRPGRVKTIRVNKGGQIQKRKKINTWTSTPYGLCDLASRQGNPN